MLLSALHKSQHKKRYAEFPLLLEEWSDLKDLVNILRIPYHGTVKLQGRDLTLSDTYGIWLEIRLRLAKITNSSTGLAEALLTKFDSRFDTIYSNPAMKAAIFLDPRYRMGIMRNQRDVDEAKEFIMEMHRRVNYLKRKQHDTEQQANENQDADTSDEFNIQAEIAQYWLNQNNSPSNTNVSDFESCLDTFDPPNMLINESVLEYWCSNKCDSQLQEVAKAIFSISPCETQCERDFSSLKRILSDLRFNLLPETLESILTINLNKDIYLEVNSKQVEEMRKNKRTDSQ